MKKKKSVNCRNITALMLIFVLLMCTACAKKQNEPKIPVDDILSEEGTKNTSSAPDTVQLNFSAQDFHDIPLNLLNDIQIGSIVNSTKLMMWSHMLNISPKLKKILKVISIHILRFLG